MEEELLEYIWNQHKQGKGVKQEELMDEFDITHDELIQVEKKMVENGFVFEKNDVYYELTNVGKIHGERLLEHHNDLRCFLQLTCGLDKEVAEENACRVQRVVDSQIFEGVENYLYMNRNSDHVMNNVELNMLYEKGEYEFCMSIYKANIRYPRRFARENDDFCDRIKLIMDEESSWFCFMPKNLEYNKNFWVLCGEEWCRSERTECGFKVPSDAFVIKKNFHMPIREGEALAAFTRGGKRPEETQIREINIHLW